jgi:polysaccharide export outer membrane protein
MPVHEDRPFWKRRFRKNHWYLTCSFEHLEVKNMLIKRMNCRLGTLAMALTLGLSLISMRVVAQGDTLDAKLVRYVRDAKKAGQMQTDVQQKAVKAGWPPAAVSEAVAYVYGAQNPAATSNATPASSGNSGSGPALGPDNRQPPTGIALNNAKDKPAVEASAGSSPTVPKTRPDSAVSGTVPPVPYEYRIGAGDALEISVWKEPEASAKVMVRPDGVISTPLIKEIQVAGLTPKQAETLITEKLVKVIQEPDVTVVVIGMNSKKIYAIGAVKKEGPIPYTYSMTVMQAISEAGGLTDYAKRNKISVLRNENGKETKFPFRYDEVIKGNHMELNILLLPGDTLVVPH